MTLYSIFEKGI